MKISRAHHMGMCFGVRDAIDLAHREADRSHPTILGELVHNATVLQDLESRGVAVVQNLDDVRTDTVIITAHGASEKRLQQVAARGHRVVEATCPLVRYAHQAARKLEQDGYFPVVIGKQGHVEVHGIVDDLREYALVLSEADIDALSSRPRFGVMSQTTQPIQHVRALVDRLRRRFPDSEVRFVDTVCQPTKQRQQAAVSLGDTSDVVVVVGGANSNNTRQLAETARQAGARAYHVQGPDNINPQWFSRNDRVGLTAGTSTPDSLIDAVEARLNQIAETLALEE